MNKRIREAWLKAANEDSDPDNWDTQEQFIERFAKVIVEECLILLKKDQENYTSDEHDTYEHQIAMEIADSVTETHIDILKQHFGIKQ